MSRLQQIRARVAWPARAVGGLARRLGAGIPVGVVAALAAVVLVLILYTVATREERSIRAYAEFTMFPASCAVEPTRQRNAIGCQIVGPGAYVLRFSESLEGSTVMATRGSCCPGTIASSIADDNTVIVTIGRPATEPVRASLVAP